MHITWLLCIHGILSTVLQSFIKACLSTDRVPTTFMNRKASPPMFTCNICSFLNLTRSDSATDVTAYSVRLRSFGEKTCCHIQVERREGDHTVVGPFGMREHVWLDQWHSHCPEYSDLSVAAKLHILNFNLSWSPTLIPLIWPSVKVSVNWDETMRLLSQLPPLSCYWAYNSLSSQAVSLLK